jgi:hypothetical protein
LLGRGLDHRVFGSALPEPAVSEAPKAPKGTKSRLKLKTAALKVQGACRLAAKQAGRPTQRGCRLDPWLPLVVFLALALKLWAVVGGPPVLALGDECFGQEPTEHLDTHHAGSRRVRVDFKLAGGEEVADHMFSEEVLGTFQSIDRDDNGFITAVELHQHFAEFGYESSSEELDGEIRYFDTDGDGQLNYAEFVEFELDGVGEQADEYELEGGEG